jgi:hypothetical protein
MRKDDVRQFIRHLEAMGLTLESTRATTASLPYGKPFRNATACRSRRRSRPTRSTGVEPR